MQIKNILLLAYLLVTTIVWANNTPNALNIRLESPSASICEVPAPDNFHVEQIGTTWVELAWNMQPGAVGGYRIRTYRSSDNFLVSTITQAQTLTTVTINGLDPETEYYSIINSICTDGENSVLEGDVSFITVILDLLVNGYQPPGIPIRECAILSSGSYCEFPSGPSIAPFRIGNGLLYRDFGMNRLQSPDEERYRCHLTSNNNNATFKFYCSPNVEAPCSNATIMVTFPINEIETTIAQFTVSGTQSFTSKLTCNFLANGFILAKLKNPGSGGNLAVDPTTHFIRPRDNGTPEANLHVAASPNPFSETLDIFPNYPEAENIHVQLFNLSGQKVLDQQFAGGQEQYTLSTATLANGFYLLRIEADGETQTLKVVKSE